jgi:hypothetical protein
VSRLFDRVPRRASPGLDTDLSDLGLDFIYSGYVRFTATPSVSLRCVGFFTQHNLFQFVHMAPKIHSARMQTARGEFECGHTGRQRNRLEEVERWVRPLSLPTHPTRFIPAICWRHNRQSG